MKSARVQGNVQRNGVLENSPLEEMELILEQLVSNKLEICDDTGPTQQSKEFIVNCLHRGVRNNLTSDALPELAKIQARFFSAKLKIQPGSAKSPASAERAAQVQMYLRESILAHLRGTGETVSAEGKPRRRPRKPASTKYEFSPFAELDH